MGRGELGHLGGGGSREVDRGFYVKLIQTCAITHLQAFLFPMYGIQNFMDSNFNCRSHRTRL